MVAASQLCFTQRPTVCTQLVALGWIRCLRQRMKSLAALGARMKERYHLRNISMATEIME
eukprot:COSAG01_NODE_50671_length_361_cov_0.984733_1_plen_59_part_01